jgi:serine/threonine protein kinase
MSGHVSEKTDSYAFGVVLCELLTGNPPADYGSGGEMLSMRMYGPLSEGTVELELPPMLDGACKWPRPRVLALGRIARRCIEFEVRKRCTVAEVLSELDELAGRMAVRRAGRGEEYDPMTGKLVQKQAR